MVNINQIIIKIDWVGGFENSSIKWLGFHEQFWIFTSNITKSKKKTHAILNIWEYQSLI